MDGIILLEHVAPADDVHIKYLQHSQTPTTASLPAKLNSVQLYRQAGSQCVEQIMIQQQVSYSVAGHASCYVPGMRTRLSIVQYYERTKRTSTLEENLPQSILMNVFPS